MEDNSNMKRTTVVINGKKYPLIYSEEDEYIHLIERYVNGKIEKLSKEGMQLSETAALVIVAITVANELFQTQKNFNALKTDVARMLNEYDELKSENDDLIKENEDLRRRIGER